MTFYGEYWYHGLGAHVSGAGDVNGDGYDDRLINAPFDDIVGDGRIYLYFGGQNPDPICDLYFQDETELQFDSPSLGDVNNDEFDDLIFFKYGLSNEGVVQIHYGCFEMDTVPDLQWTGSPTQFYRFPIAGIGDLNNNGYDDWLIRCSINDIWLCFGSPEPDTSLDLLFQPEPPSSNFYQHAVGGDINGDGIDDLVLGAFSSGWTSGQVLGYLGGANIDSHYDYLYDSGTDNRLGTTVGLADINGDGILEVLAGASQIDWGPGQVWLFTTQVQTAPLVQMSPNNSSMLTVLPNPFNQTAIIHYDLAAPGPVRLTIHEVSGRKVYDLYQENELPGSHTIEWRTDHLGSGLYFVRLESGATHQTVKAVLVK